MKMNTLTITGYEQVQIKHFLDSLTLVPAIRDAVGIKADLHLIDVGTGAGMPGIALKILLPKTRVALLDSVSKKTAFLQHIIDRMRLDYVNIITGRAEEVGHQPEYRERFDIVVSRAVTKLPTTIEFTLPFCRIGGLTIAQKKGAIGEELSQAARAIDILGGKLREVKEVNLQLLAETSCAIGQASANKTLYYFSYFLLEVIGMNVCSALGCPDFVIFSNSC